MQALFFIPIFNEREHLPIVLQQVRKVRSDRIEFLLVNNGSTDGSEIIVRESGLPQIEIEQNLGVGYSYMRALDWALSKRTFDLFGAIAANGKMRPSEIPRLLSPLLSGEADYVTGSRYLKGGSMPGLPRFRRNAIPLVSQIASLILRHTISDATCGFRAFRLDTMHYARFDWHQKWLYTYGFEYYLFAKFLLCKELFVKEVPITMDYSLPRKKMSKIRPVLDWPSMLLPWVVARMERLSFDTVALHQDRLKTKMK